MSKPCRCVQGRSPPEASPAPRSADRPPLLPVRSSHAAPCRPPNFPAWRSARSAPGASGCCARSSSCRPRRARSRPQVPHCSKCMGSPAADAPHLAALHSLVLDPLLPLPRRARPTPSPSRSPQAAAARHQPAGGDGAHEWTAGLGAGRQRRCTGGGGGGRRCAGRAGLQPERRRCRGAACRQEAPGVWQRGAVACACCMPPAADSAACHSSDPTACMTPTLLLCFLRIHCPILFDFVHPSKLVDGTAAGTVAEAQSGGHIWQRPGGAGGLAANPYTSTRGAPLGSEMF